jgi:hypothetical protein
MTVYIKRKSAKTFNRILETVASKNAKRLMERAQTANRLAKRLKGRSQRRAYEIKNKALVGLLKAFPEQMMLVNDSRTPNYVLITNARGGFGLHGPAQTFVTNRSSSLNNESWGNRRDRRVAA